MYKTTSQNMQGRAERILMKDMPAGETTITPRQESEAIQKRLRQLEAQIVAEKDKEKRAALGLVKHNLSGRQRELRLILGEKRRTDMAQYIVDAMKARVTKIQYEIIMADARKAFDEAHPAITEPNSP